MITYRVVLLGNQGTGKTTFFNKITGSKEKTKLSGKSCTRQIVQATSICELGFDVIDTPGFNSREDKLVHIAGILAALSYGRVDRMLIIIKFGRDDEILDQLDKVYKPVKRFKDLVTIIITHWDYSKDQQQDQLLVQQIMKEKQIDSFLFIQENDDVTIILNQLKDILVNHPNDKTVKLLESEIYGYFDFLELEEDDEEQIDSDRHNVQLKFKNVARSYKKFIQNLSVDEEYYLDILHEISLFVREEANKIVEQFEQQNGEKIQNLVDKKRKNIHYLHYISLKKSIWDDLQSVVKLAQEKMTKKQKHFYNFMRKCNYCKQIWLKVIGCDGETICGQRVHQKQDDLLTLSRYKNIRIIKNENDEIQFQLNESLIKQEYSYESFIKEIQDNLNFNNITKEQIEVVLQRCLGTDFQEQIRLLYVYDQQEYQILKNEIRLRIDHIYNNEDLFFYDNDFFSNQLFNRKQNKGVGCGQKIIWREMLPLSDQEMKELLSPELMDYLADQEQLRKDETEFINREYKSLINQEIKNQISNIKVINNRNQNQEQQLLQQI